MGSAISQTNNDDSSPNLKNDIQLSVNMDSQEASDKNELVDNTENTVSDSIDNDSESLEDFKEKFEVKREQRKLVISALKNEIQSLRDQLKNERETNGTSDLRKELGNVYHDLQLANAEILSLREELDVTKNQVNSLKEVQVVSKQMLQLREDQVTQVIITIIVE